MASSGDNDYRQTLAFQAKLADQAERYDDMAATMKKLAKLGVSLAPEERSLLTQAFKKSVRRRRSSLITLSSTDHDHDHHHQILRESCRQRIESEIKDICNDVVSLVDDHLIPSSSSNCEDEVFYLKMKGDYYRYLSELNAGFDREKLAGESLKAYETAAATAEAELAVTHPVRLGVALNLSVLHYEVLKSTGKAFEVAEQAYDEALPELINLDGKDASYQDTVAILRLLGDNLTMWKEDHQR